MLDPDLTFFRAKPEHKDTLVIQSLGVQGQPQPFIIREQVVNWPIIDVLLV